MEKTLLLVGLGNPGKEYEKTRHNIGWMFLDYLKSIPDAEFEEWKEKKKLNALIAKGNVQLPPERSIAKSKDYINEILRPASPEREQGGQVQRVNVILAKPTTFMNNSGLAVQKLVTRYALRLRSYRRPRRHRHPLWRIQNSNQPRPSRTPWS